MIRAILLDETPYLADDFKERHRITRYGTIYLYNDEEHTHCCSLTPSYWLVSVDYAVELRDNAPVSDTLDEELRECVAGTDPGYYNVRGIDRAKSHFFNFTIEQYPYETQEAFDSRLMDAAIEAWHVNPGYITFGD